MQARDVAAIRELLEQLGYNLSETEVGHRFDAVAATQGHGAFIAELGGEPVALLHLDRSSRVGGIGRQVMAFAECWARERGHLSICLTSQIDRCGSHAFYAKLGYRRVATSHMFRKEFTSS